MDELASRLATNPTAALEERAAAAEARAKQLSASLARKEAALRDAKAALEEAKAKAEDSSRKGAGSGGNGAGDELERQLKVNGRLRAELARKEAALQVRGEGWRGPVTGRQLAALAWAHTAGCCSRTPLSISVGCGQGGVVTPGTAYDAGRLCAIKLACSDAFLLPDHDAMHAPRLPAFRWSMKFANT